LAYRNECDFLKFGDGNPIQTPEIVEPEHRGRMANGRANDHGGQNWLPGDQRLPTRERSSGPDSGMMITPPLNFHTGSAGYGDNASSGETNSPNPDGQSSRPTPNSSTASDHRHSTSGTGPMSSSGRTSFEASPIGSTQNLGTQGEVDRNAFFQDSLHNSFQMPGGTGMTPGRSFSITGSSGNELNLPNGWDIPGQTGTGMTPVAQGVLQHLMDMPPMDAMDLGWDSGT
jgi:hypothetical protein